MSEEERSIHYKCIIRDFSAAHRMDGARRVAHAGGRFSCRRWARLGRGASSTATRAAISSRWSIRPLSSASTTRDVLRDVSGGARGGRPQRRRWLERHRPERHRARVIFQPLAQQRPGRSSASSLPQATRASHGDVFTWACCYGLRSVCYLLRSAGYVVGGGACDEVDSYACTVSSSTRALQLSDHAQAL